MASLFAPATTTSSKPPPFFINPNPKTPFFSTSLSLLSNPNRTNQLNSHFLCYNAAPKHQSGPVKKRSSPSNNKKRKKKGFSSADDFKIGNDNNGEFPRKNQGYDDLDVQDDFQILGKELPGSSKPKSKSLSKPKLSRKNSSSSRLRDRDMDSDWEDGDLDNANKLGPWVLPKPPAGFVLDPEGRVALVSNKRLVTIVDPADNAPLECVIRRVFRSSKGDECMLLCPVDMPVQLMKSTNFAGWAGVGDDELEALLPTVAFALAKIHMYLVPSGFCYTARGGFCFSEDAIFDINPDTTGEGIAGRTTEAVEITNFNKDGSHYMLYTPSDPLLFVAVKDQNGQLIIAEDDIMEDPATARAIDEETEFTALVEAEEALFTSLLGEEVVP